LASNYETQITRTPCGEEMSGLLRHSAAAKVVAPVQELASLKKDHGQFSVSWHGLHGMKKNGN
jgi:hypothetical protein